MTNDVLITDELVERVARVICTNAESAMVSNGGGWRSYIDATRAALAVVVPEIVERCAAYLLKRSDTFRKNDPNETGCCTLPIIEELEDSASSIRLLGG